MMHQVDANYIYINTYFLIYILIFIISFFII